MGPHGSDPLPRSAFLERLRAQANRLQLVLDQLDAEIAAMIEANNQYLRPGEAAPTKPASRKRRTATPD